jgi:glucokinase
MILAGDIGGTKTRLALFDEAEKIIKEEVFPSKEYNSLSDILKIFIEDVKVSKAVFGIAGPIQNNRCKATNLPWVVEGDKIAQTFHMKKAILINDLLANAYGTLTLNEEDFVVLQKGEKHPGNAALISAGTGLGEAGFYWDGKKYHPFPSEGGHCDFAPRNNEEIELLHFLQEKYGHVSYERLVSGQGISNIYQFLTEKKKMERISGDVTPKVITAHAKDQSSPTAIKTVEWFFSIYGSEAANMALKCLALSGVYLGGGILPKVIDFLEREVFLQGFHDKGRFASLLKTIPIKVIRHEKTALLGAFDYSKQV